MPRKRRASSMIWPSLTPRLTTALTLTFSPAAARGGDPLEHPSRPGSRRRSWRGTLRRRASRGSRSPGGGRQPRAPPPSGARGRRSSSASTSSPPIPASTADENLEVAPQQRLAARDPDLLDTERDKRPDEPLDLLEREQLLPVHEPVAAAEDLLRHAVDAAEVAAVGDRDPQIVQRPTEPVRGAGAAEGPGWGSSLLTRRVPGSLPRAPRE